jgi:Zn-finger nucleic acid-binding protein
MPAVVCPSCRCKLKAPSKLVGKKATCPRCRAAVLVPAAEVASDPVMAETKEHRAPAVAPDAETFEAVALDATAEQSSVKLTAPPAADQDAPIERRQAGLLIRTAVFLTLASAAAFALWMAIPGGQAARAPQLAQPQK